MKRICLVMILFSFIMLQAKEVSVKKAVLFSALLPGTGELYSNNKTGAVIFLSSELALITSLFRTNQEIKWAQDNYKQFALTKAGVPKDRTEEYYNSIENYMSSEDYNQEVIQSARNFYLLYYYEPEEYQKFVDENSYSSEYSWDWGSNQNRKQYRDLRVRKQKFEITSNFIIGAMLVNRVVSVINAAKSAKGNNRKFRDLGSLSVQPDFIKSGVKLNYEIQF